MQIRRSLTAATALLLTGALAPAAARAQLGVQQERNAPTVYAITNARIVPGSGPAIERGTVVIRNGVIAAVGANATAPADARTVDGTGLTVYPGFIEGYGSLGMASPRGGGAAGGRGGAAPGGPQAFFLGQQQQQGPAGAANSLHPAGQQPEILAVDQLDPADDAFSAAQAAGFTAALTAPTSGIFVGQSAVIELRDGAVQEILLRSPVAMHVGFSTARGFGGGYPNSLLGVFAALRQTLLDAQHYGAEQAAYAASPRGMARPATDASLAALQPVLERRMPVVMTANSQREIERALDMAREFKLKAIIAGGEEAYLVADRLKAESVPVLLSIDFPSRPTTRGADAEPEPLRVLRARVEAPHTAAKLADAGVRVILASGGDYADFLANLQRAVESGLPRDAALRALTVAPAELFGLSDRLGTIEVGKIANLTVSRGDIFARGSRVTQLFVDGRAVTVRAPAGGAGAAATMAGTWTVTVTLEGSDHPITLGLQQTGETLRGTLQGSLGTGQVSNSSINEAGEFRFTSTVTLPEGSEEATFAGTLEGNTMRGTVTIIGHNPGTFVGTRPNEGGAGGARGQRPGAGRPPQR